MRWGSSKWWDPWYPAHNVVFIHPHFAMLLTLLKSFLFALIISDFFTARFLHLVGLASIVLVHFRKVFRSHQHFLQLLPGRLHRLSETVWSLCSSTGTHSLFWSLERSNSRLNTIRKSTIEIGNPWNKPVWYINQSEVCSWVFTLTTAHHGS